MAGVGLKRSRQYDHAEYQPKRRVGQKPLNPFCGLINEKRRRMLQSKLDDDWIQPHPYFSKDMPSSHGSSRPVQATCPKWTHTVYIIDPQTRGGERQRRPMFTTLCWTPDGRRLISGNTRGEFTLWHGVSLASEMRAQGHEDARVTSVQWVDQWEYMISGDDKGRVKYWACNMNCLGQFDATREQRIRELTLSPSSAKLACASEDGVIRIWDNKATAQERELQGHGGDVTTAHWHPTKSLIASGSSDKAVILWDPRAGDRISSLLGHTNTVTKVRWNPGNYEYLLLTASKDTTIKLFDIRKQQELHAFAGHKKDVLAIDWHPVHKELFASGGMDGVIAYWIIGHGRVEARIGDAADHRDVTRWVSAVHKSHGEMRNPNPVVDLSWHPLGHMIASASWETKFWTHNKPGDTEEVRGVDVTSSVPDFALEAAHASRARPQMFSTEQRGTATLSGPNQGFYNRFRMSQVFPKTGQAPPPPPNPAPGVGAPAMAPGQVPVPVYQAKGGKGGWPPPPPGMQPHGMPPPGMQHGMPPPGMQHGMPPPGMQPHGMPPPGMQHGIPPPGMQPHGMHPGMSAGMPGITPPGAPDGPGAGKGSCDPGKGHKGGKWTPVYYHGAPPAQAAYTSAQQQTLPPPPPQQQQPQQQQQDITEF